MKFDCVIIGAGAAGMSAALILARAGQKVALVEKAARTAPVLRGFRRQGVQFDTGFHYTGGLGEGEPLDLFFRHLGLAGRLEKKAYDPDGFDVIRDAGRGGDSPSPTASSGCGRGSPRPFRRRAALSTAISPRSRPSASAPPI
ncbi:MAG: hypothetical protein C0617_12905 [Desulfuromonas sp.]|uniref:FAD-dependent oxidoreductase n=1 Tax=Desulfuromonas sp. TaxID=892 RepID=UPI000CC59B2A|nr:FAD-dependent oxidoreductase [Desulfuromonas sp.]PLX82987.1 MAG: hypothetical protein C0617_12905 [Desulfuromonas sp.]